MKRQSFITLLLISVCALVSTAQTRVVAHRGYWDAPGAAQNSLRALAKADSVNCYASEFDVWMTPDGVLMVNHDPVINGVEIQNTPAVTVLREKLSNGETIPTLDQYLAEATRHPNLRLVCELKVHDSRRQEAQAIRNILALVKKYGLEHRTDYITFSRDGFCDFIKNAPQGTQVYYLTGDYTPAQIKHHGGAGIDYSLDVVKRHPEWIDQCHDLGLKVNVWTVNTPADMQWCIDRGVDFITTNAPEQCLELTR